MRCPIAWPHRPGAVLRSLLAATILALGGGVAAADPLIQVFAIRGFAGVVFSRGMNQLCEELTRIPQVGCIVDDFYREAEIARKAAAAATTGQRLVLVGHSYGAHAALRVATTIKSSVHLIVSIDPNWFPSPPMVPENAEIVLNYYQDIDVLGRATLQPSADFRGQLHQFVRKEPHVLIDRSPDIHAEITLRIRTALASLNNPRPGSMPPPDRRPR